MRCIIVLFSPIVNSIELIIFVTLHNLRVNSYAVMSPPEIYDISSKNTSACLGTTRAPGQAINARCRYNSAQSRQVVTFDHIQMLSHVANCRFIVYQLQSAAGLPQHSFALY
jgi:hypothetical protein